MLQLMLPLGLELGPVDGTIEPLGDNEGSDDGEILPDGLELGSKDGTDDKLGPDDGMKLGSDESIDEADGRELGSSEGLMLPLGLELGPHMEQSNHLETTNRYPKLMGFGASTGNQNFESLETQKFKKSLTKTKMNANANNNNNNNNVDDIVVVHKIPRKARCGLSPCVGLSIAAGQWTRRTRPELNRRFDAARWRAAVVAGAKCRGVAVIKSDD
jgi:hypothetical protein